MEYFNEMISLFSVEECVPTPKKKRKLTARISGELESDMVMTDLFGIEVIVPEPVVVVKESTKIPEDYIVPLEEKESTVITPEIETPLNRFRLQPDSLPDRFHPTERCEANLEALRLQKVLMEENREATLEEKVILSKYSGWGALPHVFEKHISAYTTWYAPANDLKELLSETEFEAVKASTTTAFYTPIWLCQFIWQVLQWFGFKNGKVLEPACGIGHFIGSAPDEIARKTKFTAVEKDSITGNIASLLYPEANFNVMGLEETDFPKEYFDAVIGNPPFGDFKVYDREEKKYNLHIHHYFVKKTMGLLRPGGIAAFVLPLSFLNGRDQGKRARKLVSLQANFIAAFRLPTSVFKNFSGTETAVDVVFLKKRMDGETANEDWLGTTDFVVEGKYKDTVCFINQWFIEHPEYMLGTPALDRFSGFTLEKDDSIDVEAKMAELLTTLPQNIYKAMEGKAATARAFRKGEGSFTLIDGHVAIRCSDEVVYPEYNAKDTEKLRLMIDIRNITRDLLDLQFNNESDEIIAEFQKLLNDKYNEFVFKYGYLSNKVNRALFAPDPDAGLVLALEEHVSPDVYKKAAIFTKRTIQPNLYKESAETAEEALSVSLCETGRVNMDRIGNLLGKPEEEIIKELAGLIYKNPKTDEWESAAVYLSGNVKEKLQYAKKAAEDDPYYQGNISALEAVQPPDLEYSDIDARLGAPWIAEEDYSDFATHILGSEWVKIVRISDGWRVVTEAVHAYRVSSSVANTKEWGTSRAPFTYLLESGLNGRLPEIKDKETLPDGRDRYYLNTEETAMARALLEKVKEEFRSWIWVDADRRQRLAKIYNEEYNNIRLATYDGSHLTFPGISKEVELRSVQKNAVWRVITSPENVLLAHEVGVGKTYSMQCAAMRMKQMGLVNKPLLLVPSANVEDFTNEFRKLYPFARILPITIDDLPAVPKIKSKETLDVYEERRDEIRAKRKKTLLQVATGDWDAVITTHDIFKRIPVSPEWQDEFIRDQIRELEDTIYSITDERDRSSARIVKQLEKQKSRLEEMLLRGIAEEKKDIAVPFEQLGVDLLVVDEADLYKNLAFTTKQTRVAGIQNSGSERSMDLFMKIRWLDRLNKKTVFATGTPISNTIAEMYTLMRYMCYEKLERKGIVLFDDWAATFGEVVNSLERSPDGKNWRTVARFANFINAPELISIFRSFADVVTAETAKIPRPQIEGGERVVVSSKPSSELETYIREVIMERVNAIKNRRVTPDVDNMLKVTGDCRKASLDYRLISPRAPFDPQGKVAKLVHNVHEIWKSTQEEKAAQIVFCDLGIPKPSEEITVTDEFGAEETVYSISVYGEIKKYLVAYGIPAEEIAFIHDAKTPKKREELFQKVRAGLVRVLIGSTNKCGVGVNVQERLYAEHHLDCPWRPRDLEQREGRILRQGNRYPFVRIFVYVTEESTDAWMWQVVKQKAKFIAQILKGDLTSRTIEDVENTVLSYAEIEAIATGNPMLVEKFQVESEIEKLWMLKSKDQSDKWRMQDDISFLPRKINVLQETVESHMADIAARVDTTADKFQIVLRGTTITERKLAQSEIEKIIDETASLCSPGKTYVREIGTFAGFEILLVVSAFLAGDANVYLHAKGKKSYQASSNLGSLEYAVNKMIDKELAARKEELSVLTKRLADLKVRVALPFEKESRLKELSARLKEIYAALGIKTDDVIMDESSVA